MPKIKATGIPQIDAFISQARHDAYKAVKEAGEMLARGYGKAIQNFYGSYKPTSYIRTYSTFTAVDCYGGSPKVKFIGNNAYESGIIVDSAFIPGDPYKYHMFHGFMSTAHYNKDIVFAGTFGAGSHGGVAWSTPPAALMVKEFQDACAYVEKVFYGKYA